MKQFRKKPVVISAIQWDGSDEVADQVADACPADRTVSVVGLGQYLEIETLEGTMMADRGDWIIQGVQGELYPCKPDIFEATYEPANAVPADEAAGD